MRSTTTISAYERASPTSRPPWELPAGDNIAVCAFASSPITGRVWAVNRSQEL